MTDYMVWIDLAEVNTPSAAGLYTAEKARARSLRDAGHIRHMWRVEGRRSTVSVWRADDRAELDVLLASLPLSSWMDVRIEALSPHYLFDGEATS